MSDKRENCEVLTKRYQKIYCIIIHISLAAKLTEAQQISHNKGKIIYNNIISFKCILPFPERTYPSAELSKRDASAPENLTGKLSFPQFSTLQHQLTPKNLKKFMVIQDKNIHFSEFFQKL